MNMFNPANWYWQSASGRIYSSSKQAITNEKDKDFTNWKAAGNLPTPWPKDAEGKETDAALADILAPYGLRLFPPTLAEVKHDLQAKVDEAAENECNKYTSNGSGQMAIYREKADQAVAYSKKWFDHRTAPDKVPEPNDNDYLLLKAGIGIEGRTMIEVAALVTQTYAEWQVIGAAIERARLKSKIAIAEAKTAEEAQAIFAAIKWPNTETQDNTATTT